MNMPFDDKTIAQEDLLAGRFRRVRKLGGGGMGEVFLVEDTKLYNHQFAVKMIPAILVSNRRAYEQIKKEALVTLNLVHSNIVQVRAVEENDGAPFIVMDYVEGESLADIIARKGCLKEEEALTILRPIAAALDFAHSKKVVHRDVKPSNVMVAKDGTPYILDFGIASEIKETMTRMTGNSISGTPPYMSPEQMRGAAPAPLQDVYSFAAMAYECLAGNPPFYRGDISWQIVNEAPQPLPDGISIAAGIMAGLAKTPGERPANCAGVISVQKAEVQSSECVQALESAERKAQEQSSAPKAGDIRIITLPGGAKMEMIYCAPGEFMMGSPEDEEECYDNETQHSVRLMKGFWLGKYEVTQAQWQSVMGTNPSEFEGDDKPVDSVSWFDCQEFIKKVNAVGTDLGAARLPTEAEWEYACRAGSTGEYSGELDRVAWYDRNSGDKTHLVGQKQPNAWGFYDMHGNVWEWCNDWYENWYGAYPTVLAVDPTGPNSGSDRVLRGGSWLSGAKNCRSASRSKRHPSDGWLTDGFRLCCSAGL